MTYFGCCPFVFVLAYVENLEENECPKTEVIKEESVQESSEDFEQLSESESSTSVSLSILSDINDLTEDNSNSTYEA